MVSNSTTTSGPPPSSSSSTSSSLLVQLKAGKPEAWQQLVDLYGPLIYYWCRNFGLQPADAADVFQDVLATVAANIVRFTYERGQGRFRGWLWTIARNKIRDHFRRKGKETEALGHQQPAACVAEVPDQWAEPPESEEDSRQLTSLFHRGLLLVRAEFEPRTWDIFCRVMFDGQSVGRVVEELDVTAGAVRQAKSRVLRRLRIVLGELLD